MEVLSTPTKKHQLLLKFLLLVFFNYFETRGGNVLSAQLRMRIRPGKFREPDLLLLLSHSDPRGQDRFWVRRRPGSRVIEAYFPPRRLVKIDQKSFLRSALFDSGVVQAANSGWIIGC